MNRHAIAGTLTVLFATGAFSNAESTAISSGRWAIHSKQPAERWQDAMVTGNGRHGTMATGQPGHARIICVHEELFLRAWDREKEAVADIANLLPEVRRLIDEGKPREAHGLGDQAARKQLVEMGAAQVYSLFPHPAFDLQIDLTLSGKPTEFQRRLDLETGEVRTHWQDEQGSVEQRIFSSRKHNVIVVRLNTTGARKLNGTLSLTETPGREGNYLGIDLKQAIASTHSEATADGLYYHANYGFDRGGYEGVARVIASGGQTTATGDRLRVTDAEQVLIVLRINPLSDGTASDREALQEELAQLSPDYQDLLVPHARQHGEMFRRVTLDLGCAEQWQTTPTETMLDDAHSQGVTPLLLEQMHAMGRYLLISSSGKYPPPLQGIWAGGWRPAWAGGFVMDSNLYLATSAAAMGNLPECAESYFGYVERILPGWRLNARKYLGCRGFLVPHYSDPEKGYLSHFAGMYAWMYWPSGGGWNIQPFYDYGLLTGDQKFMKDRVLPLYREMADFYEDFLVKEDDGRYHFTPSISPENFPSNFRAAMVVKDSTIDIAVAREVFEVLIKLGEQFGLDDAKIKKWKHYRENLVQYRINQDGALAEWVPEVYHDNYRHRHASHLYPIFPGLEFFDDATDPALFKAARVALAKRVQHDTRKAHGLIHEALMASRLKETEVVRLKLDRFSRRRFIHTGLVTSHDPNHKIYNLDASLSLPRLLMQMLVFSRPGHIDLLPAWPVDYPDGAITGVLVRGGHKIDLAWADGRLTSATLYAGYDDEGTMRTGQIARPFQWKAGETYVLDGQLQLQK